MKIQYEEICLYCKQYDADRQECKRKRVNIKKDPERLSAKVNPRSKPEDQKCKSFRMSDDASFAFGAGGIDIYSENDWSKYKRETLLKKFKTILKLA